MGTGGFTLIELVIVVAIIAILAAIAIVWNKEYQSKIACKAIAEAIAKDLRLLQYKALTTNRSHSLRFLTDNRYSLFQVSGASFKEVKFNSLVSVRTFITSPGLTISFNNFPSGGAGNWAFVMPNWVGDIVVVSGRYTSIVTITSYGDILVDSTPLPSITPPNIGNPSRIDPTFLKFNDRSERARLKCCP